MKKIVLMFCLFSAFTIVENAQMASSLQVISDDMIERYVLKHPEVNPAFKKSKAERILQRVKAGEDFASLANQFSDDPGNKDFNSVPLGGLYVDVPKGRMVLDFENAALALKPGQIAPELVETDFGFHIIKLERRLEKKGGEETYDVRHILISTGVLDTLSGRILPYQYYVRNKLEEEKRVRSAVASVQRISAQSATAADKAWPGFFAKLRKAVQKKDKTALRSLMASPFNKNCTTDGPYLSSDQWIATLKQSSWQWLNRRLAKPTKYWEGKHTQRVNHSGDRDFPTGDLFKFVNGKWLWYGCACYEC